MRFKGAATTFAMTLTLSTILSGCGYFNNNSIDPPPKQVNYVKANKLLNTGTKQGDPSSQQKKSTNKTAKTVKRELYLLDAVGRVAPQVINVPESNSVAKQALEYLVKDGPVENKLPNGFQAVLPAGTIVKGVNLLKDGTLVADFSKDITNYKPSEEAQILQAITWTLTQFNNVNKVQIRINGVNQKVMPVGKTPIGDGLTRANGINNDMGNVVDVTNSDNVTLYFLAQHGNHYYYVPVTRRINQSDGDIIGAVNGLIQGPTDSGLLTAFGSDVKLVKNPIIKDGIVTLDFNKDILMKKGSDVISDKALDTLVLTLTSQPGVKGVSVQVNGVKKVMDESGLSLTKPVTKTVLHITGI